jgi:hypothetical protein
MGLCGLVIAAVIGKVDADVMERTCSQNDSSEDSPLTLGRSLLQSKRTNNMQQENFARANQPQQFATGTGNIAPLDETGFISVRAECCTPEMAEFIRRLLLSKGLGVCGTGGLFGTALWYDCTDDDPKYDFASLNSMLSDPNSKAAKGDCPWVGQPPNGCPSKKSSCPTFPSATYPPCKVTTTTPPLGTQPPTGSPTTPTTTTAAPAATTPTTPSTTVADVTCCKPEPEALLLGSASSVAHARGLVPTSSAVSSVTPFDCATYPAPIQVLKKNADSFYQVSQLDIATGEYTQIYQIPLTRNGITMNEELNSAGINPIDQMAYATTLIDGEYYVLRHDKDKLEFVARLPPPAEYHSQNVGYNSATFSLSEKYYLLTKGKAQSIIVIENLHTLQGHSIPSDVTLTYDKNSLPGKELLPGEQLSDDTHWIADTACISENYDGLGQAEYCFMLDKTNTMYLVKVPNGLVASAVIWQLQATGDEGSGLKVAKADGYGAAWSYKDRVFFASNVGRGVYEVDQKSIDLQAKTIKMKYVGKSSATTKNDGMNCLDVDSPWPDQGDCPDGNVQVQPVGGQCPAGSVKQ